MAICMSPSIQAARLISSRGTRCVPFLSTFPGSLSSRGFYCTSRQLGSRTISSCQLWPLTGEGATRKSTEFQKSFKRNVRTTPAWSPQLGTEPGLDSSINTRNDEVSCQQNGKESATITIVDYSTEDLVRHDVEPTSFGPFLKDNPKPDWASCRWIYVNGIDQEILRSLGSTYNLHRLALEDVLESRGPTKADWYDGHLFIAMPIHKLLHSSALGGEPHGHKQKLGNHRNHQHHRDWRTIAHQKFNISVEQGSLFWTNTGTIITIFQKSGEDVFAPVLNRLDSSHSIPRSTDDPSMLIQAVIDVAVDLCMPIEKVFADEFAAMELNVLSTPAIQQSRSLYILRSRLTLLLDNFIAINSLLNKLCGDHPLSPNSILMPGATAERERINVESMASHGSNGSYPSQVKNSVTISPTTRLYLRDVLDHVHTLSASTDVAIRSTENLTSLIFNTIAASQNESVRQLTVVSSFFLPLTFLTGYMGMNFQTMPVVQEHSDLVFWAIAAPAIISMGLFMRIRARKRLMSSGSWVTWARKSRK